MEDIRLLGRILGEVIREQDGKDAFELIERVRQLSVAYRLKRDTQAGRALDRFPTNNDRSARPVRCSVGLCARPRGRFDRFFNRARSRISKPRSHDLPVYLVADDKHMG